MTSTLDVRAYEGGAPPGWWMAVNPDTGYRTIMPGLFVPWSVLGVPWRISSVDIQVCSTTENHSSLALGARSGVLRLPAVDALRFAREIIHAAGLASSKESR